MQAHYHVGGLDFLVDLLHLLIAMFLLRYTAAWIVARNPDSRIGKGIAAIVF